MSTRVYVGNLDDRADERDIEDMFDRYGRIRDVFVKRPPRGMPFAFVEFDRSRDAEDAVYELNGRRLLGSRIRVEHSRSRADRGDRGHGSGPPRRAGKSPYRVRVEGLPKDTSWQDLKDFIRGATNNITRADVNGSTGFVELASKQDVHAIMDKLDDTECENRFKSRARVTIKIESDGGSRSPSPRGSGKERRRSRSRSRSRGRGRARSRSRSGSRGRSRSASRSRSGSKPKPAARSRSRSRSASRGRSRSPSRSGSRGRSRSPSPKAAGNDAGADADADSGGRK